MNLAIVLMDGEENIRNKIIGFLTEQENLSDLPSRSENHDNIQLDLIKINTSHWKSRSYVYKVEVTYLKSLSNNTGNEGENHIIEEEYTQEFYLAENYSIIGFSKKRLERCNRDFGHLPLDLDKSNRNKR